MISPPTRLGPGRQLRVHVLGSSASVLVEPSHGPRDQGTYGEQLAPLLCALDLPTVVSHAGTWFGRISDAMPHYERDVRDHFPDVLVINYGIVECQSGVLPTPLVRHLSTWHRSSRAGARHYRTQVTPRIWKQLREFQRWTSAHDHDRTYRLRPSRFVADLTRTIELVRKDCAPLVLVLDIDPPGDRIEHWLPGTRRRADRYNALLAEVTAAFGGDVRLVRAGAALTDPSTQLPDGMHRSTQGHAATAQLLAAEIVDWLGR